MSGSTCAGPRRNNPAPDIDGRHDVAPTTDNSRPLGKNASGELPVPKTERSSLRHQRQLQARSTFRQRAVVLESYRNVKHAETGKSLRLRDPGIQTRCALRGSVAAAPLTLQQYSNVGRLLESGNSGCDRERRRIASIAGRQTRKAGPPGR